LKCFALASLFLGWGFHGLKAQEAELATEDVVIETTWPEGRTPRLGEEVVLSIEIRNDGEADASNLEVAVSFQPPIVPTETGGTDENAMASPDRGKLRFPTIPSLPAGESRVLKVKVRGKAPGFARCRVEFTDQALNGITLLRDDLLRVR
jgi:hypothetical protein